MAIFSSLPLFIRNRRVVPGLVFFVIFCSSLAMWLAANILSDIDLSRALFWVRISFISISISLYGFLMFANRFPKPRHCSHAENLRYGTILVAVVLLILSDLFIPRVILEEGVTTVVPGPLYGLFIAYVAYTLILSIVRLSSIRELSSTHRRQALIILFGIIFAAIITLLTNLILPLIFGTNSLYWVASYAMLIFVATVAYAIVKHQLFDIRGALARSFAYFGSVIHLGLVLGILVVFIIDRLDLSEEKIQYLIISATVAVAILYPFFKNFFDRVTEKIFYRKTYSVQKAINDITGVLATSRTLDSMASLLIARLEHFVGSEKIVLIILSQPSSEEILFSRPKKWLNLQDIQVALKAVVKHKIFTVDSFGGVDENTLQSFIDQDIGLVSQLNSPNGVIGYLILGHKLNGTAYTKQDVTFISTISDECAIAVQSLGRLEEILTLNSSLETKINTATEELRTSNKKLKAIDKSKDEFISLTSHQLRTPLTTIKGYLSMMLDGDAGNIAPQQRKLLEEAFNSSQRMVHLISDFLNISRIQTGRFELELANVNLAEVLDEEIQLLRISASPRRIMLDYQKPEQFPVLTLDEGKLRQVMMNFIDNAIHYSPSGSIIKINLLASDSEIEFTVKDQGIGVPKSEQHKLFVKFARASNARQQRPDGTGIGLFMAKKVIVALAGSIIFESVEGKGSTFGFRIPIQGKK
ncbi:sensor histidine kinase [Candidatus Saccharibacteria bacterium]|nr:sensor histidine kinase [Candidatus Saccharibacteria bacterium]